MLIFTLAEHGLLLIIIFSGYNYNLLVGVEHVYAVFLFLASLYAGLDMCVATIFSTL